MSQNFFTKLTFEDEALTGENEVMVRAWFALLGGFTEIERHLRLVMARKGLNLPRFDILMLLSRHPHGLNMGDLARELVVTKGNVTGVVKRLEADGFIERVVNDNDRRIQTVKLTETGRQSFKTYYGLYAKSISGALGHLSMKELSQLTLIMSKIDADSFSKAGDHD